MEYMEEQMDRQIEAGIQDRDRYEKMIQELAMIIRMCIVRLPPNSTIVKTATDYLKKNHLEGNPLRSESQS